MLPLFLHKLIVLLPPKRLLLQPKLKLLDGELPLVPPSKVSKNGIGNGRKKSLAWNHFEKVKVDEGVTMAVCNYCKEIISCRFLKFYFSEIYGNAVGKVMVDKVKDLLMKLYNFYCFVHSLNVQEPSGSKRTQMEGDASNPYVMVHS